LNVLIRFNVLAGWKFVQTKDTYCKTKNKLEQQHICNRILFKPKKATWCVSFCVYLYSNVCILCPALVPLFCCYCYKQHLVPDLLISSFNTDSSTSLSSVSTLCLWMTSLLVTTSSAGQPATTSFCTQILLLKDGHKLSFCKFLKIKRKLHFPSFP